MSIEGVKFCDMCGGAIGLDDIAPVKVGEDGHLIQLHLHNRHANDCLAHKLTELAELHARSVIAAVMNDRAEEPVQHQA
jgi:hypothetical protein